MAMIKSLASAILVALFGIACSQPQGPAPAKKDQAASAPVAQAAAPAAPSPGNLLVATYAVPDLKGERVKSLVSALADNPGVKSAKAEQEAGLFKVTFQPGASCPRAMLGALAAVAPGVALKGVAPAQGSAPGPKHDCSACPMKKSCGESH
jgi:hypothetical protein